jgi:GrpB-like predicted nucleotidyltransferase (UPF0157 family)
VIHDVEWADWFSEEAQRLAPIFGEQLVAIHHIGSTAISGIVSKPIVDFLVEVRDIALVDSLNEAMRLLGYSPRGELGIPGRRYFRKGSEEMHTHHVHVFQTDNPEVQRHLGFRDYLIAHPLEAQAYGRLKQLLAAQYRSHPERYTDAKSGFIEEMDRRAKYWEESQRRRW